MAQHLSRRGSGEGETACGFGHLEVAGTGVSPDAVTSSVYNLGVQKLLATTIYSWSKGIGEQHARLPLKKEFTLENLIWAFRENKNVFSFLAVSRKELSTGRHTTRHHQQIIRRFGDIAAAEDDILAFVKKEQMRRFAWSIEMGWPTQEEKPADAPRQPTSSEEVPAARRHRSKKH